MAVEGIIGIKLGMTQIFAEDGNLVGCTVLQAGPCVVVQMRTKQKDGYEAAQQYVQEGLDFDLRDFVRREPWIAIAAAFAVGYVAAQIIRRVS